jgi:hypothetical protein
MAHPEPEGDAQRWPLKGFWRTWFWFSALLGVAFLIVGGVISGFIVISGWHWLRPGPLLPGLVLLGVGSVIGWQLLNTATAVTLRGDGTLILHRLRGPLRTSAARVKRARKSVLKSSYTPTVLETADGRVYLIHNRDDKKNIIDAIRDRNNELSVEI